jgi:hypothetical protein
MVVRPWFFCGAENVSPKFAMVVGGEERQVKKERALVFLVESKPSAYSRLAYEYLFAWQAADIPGPYLKQ